MKNKQRSDVYAHYIRRDLPPIRWTKSSYYLISGFILLLILIGYVWWPLVVEYLDSYNPNISIWRQIDLLLIGNFIAMSLLIMMNADISRDWLLIFIGFFGGLVIESWGTQTLLWQYYTQERPPLWIIPAWPIASLSIDRLYYFLNYQTRKFPSALFKLSYWICFIFFMVLLLAFTFPTFDKSLTIMAIALCSFLILTPVDHRSMVITFLAGSLLGYFLELWGTSRMCWTYYTSEIPPVFAVFAHGMAAVAFWRVRHLFLLIFDKTITKTLSE